MDESRLKLWLDFGKFFLGTFLIGFISLVINSSLENREVAIKESEQIGKYVEIALTEDVGVRKRFAEYFKTVSVNQKYRERWDIYFQLVRMEFDSIKNRADSLQTKIDSLLNTAGDILKPEDERRIILLEDQKYSLNKKLEVQKNVNSEIDEQLIIGLYNLNVQDQEKNEIKDYLSQNNFLLKQEGDYTKRASWMALEPTVFYYRNTSKFMAEQIAADLKKLTKKDFAIRRGAGLGVVKGKEGITFFIHNVN